MEALHESWRVARRTVAGIAVLLGVSAVSVSQAGQATWLCASTPHCKIYSSSDREGLTEFATNLEHTAIVLSRTGFGAPGKVGVPTTILGYPSERAPLPHLF